MDSTTGSALYAHFTRETTHRKHIIRQPIQHTSMQTRLSLRNEPNPRLPLIRIRYQPANNRRPTHLRLLRALPSVRVAQNELDVMLDGAPHGVAVRVGVDDEGVGAAEEVGEEVAEDVDGGFGAREWGEAHAVHFELHCLWSEA